MVQLTEKQKYEILFRVDINNQSLRKISEEMNINRLTVTKWFKQYKNDGNLDRTPGSERKKI